MSYGSSLDTKEQVRQAVDIVDLVGRYLQLRRQGRNYVGLCPWHQDSRPSLQVNPERQSFKCWVCDIGGDVFSFIMQIEGLEFREALAMLAEQAGIQLDSPRRPLSGDPNDPNAHFSESEQSAGDGKRILLQAAAWAEAQYHECLLNLPEGEPGRNYLRQRNVTPESVLKFHLGYSPAEWDWLLKRARASDFSPRLLETIGVLARSADGGKIYDRFRGRVLFSIRDPQDRPVGLGGRVLPESGSTSPAKYVNSPETPLFSKSSLLYGLDVAKDAIRKGRTALVMEGYTDCIAAHEHGFDHAVAVLGTALGERHIRILKRFADRIVLVLDGDEAGQRRTNEVLELFVAQQVDLQIVTLPEGLDPCDFLEEHGAEAFRDVLESRAVDALEHAFQTWTRGIDLENDIHAASEALERLVSIVAKAPRLQADTTRDARFREEKILQRLAARFRVPEQDIRDRMTRLRRASKRRATMERRDPPSESTAPPHRPAEPIAPFERDLLEVLVQHPDGLALVRASIPPEVLKSPRCRHIYETCCRLSDSGELPTFDRLMLEFDSPVLKGLLVELDDRGQAKRIADPQSVLKELIQSYHRHQAEQRTPVEAGILRQGELDEQQTNALLRQIEQQERARQGISDPTDG